MSGSLICGSENAPREAVVPQGTGVRVNHRKNGSLFGGYAGLPAPAVARHLGEKAAKARRFEHNGSSEAGLGRTKKSPPHHCNAAAINPLSD